MSPQSQTVGILSMVAALLVPSWWLLPQVLVGLGAFSIFSAGCVVWLEQLQPMFGSAAALSLTYQAWLVWRRPPQRRTRAMRAIFWTSLGTNIAVVAAIGTLWARYR